MKIALIGYGKMGRMIEEIALQRKHHIILKIDVANRNDFTQQNISKADVAIEFTGPDSAFENVMKCIEFGVPVVSGSTGWNHKIEEAKNFCNQQNGSFLHTSNFSIGVNIFFEVNRLLAQLMALHPEYEVTMKEIHHTQKKRCTQRHSSFFSRTNSCSSSPEKILDKQRNQPPRKNFDYQ